MYRFAPLLASALAMSDETSLMQGLKPQQVSPPKDKSKAISTLLQSATQMLKNGATPDVVDFAEATLSEIRDIVLAAIINASNTDQNLVDTTWGRFGTIIDEMSAGVSQIGLEHDHQNQLSEAHRTCRMEEQLKCYDKLTCDQEICRLWEQCEDEEEILRQRSWEIERHFCAEDANGTTAIFRDHAAGVFPPFIEQWPIVVDYCIEQYPPKREECEEFVTVLDAKTEQCDPIQLELERAACAHANTVRRVRNSFAEDWSNALRVYQRIMVEVHCLEIDRWKEWRTLASVQCLLERTTERNGRPCDESTDEIVTEVAACEAFQVEESIDHLRINYPVVPDPPVPPQPPAAPCSAAWIAQEYENPLRPLWDETRAPWHLAEPPQPPFPESTPPAHCPEPHHSHCNPRPDCEECVLIDENPHCVQLFNNGDAFNAVIDYPTPEHECSAATLDQWQVGEFDRYGEGHFSGGRTNYRISSEECQFSLRHSAWGAFSDVQGLHDDMVSWTNNNAYTYVNVPDFMDGLPAFRGPHSLVDGELVFSSNCAATVYIYSENTCDLLRPGVSCEPRNGGTPSLGWEEVDDGNFRWSFYGGTSRERFYGLATFQHEVAAGEDLAIPLTGRWVGGVAVHVH